MRRLKDINRKIAIRTQDDIPPGWESLQEIAEAEGVMPETARKMLRAAVEAGMVEARQFRRHTGHQMTSVTYWRFPDQPTKTAKGKR